MNNNYENLPAVLNANQLATALGISRAGAYQLLNTATFPTLRIGKRLLVPRDKLVEWIDVVAAVVARRHSGVNVTTAAVDNLQFKRLPQIHLLHQMGSSRPRLHAQTV